MRLNLTPHSCASEAIDPEIDTGLQPVHSTQNYPNPSLQGILNVSCPCSGLPPLTMLSILRKARLKDKEMRILML
jgi:hypothetical protein